MLTKQGHHTPATDHRRHQELPHEMDRSRGTHAGRTSAQDRPGQPAGGKPATWTPNEEMGGLCEGERHRKRRRSEKLEERSTRSTTLAKDVCCGDGSQCGPTATYVM